MLYDYKTAILNIVRLAVQRDRPVHTYHAPEQKCSVCGDHKQLNTSVVRYTYPNGSSWVSQRTAGSEGITHVIQ